MNQSIFIFLFHYSEPQWLKDVWTEQVREILPPCISMALYCQRDDRIDHMFLRSYEDGNLMICFVSGASYI